MAVLIPCLLLVVCLVFADSLQQSIRSSVMYSHQSSIIDIKLLYADSDILVVDKPANINTAPGVIPNASLANYVADMFKINRVDQMIAHRLDYGTSGVVVFARNVDSLTHLHSQFRQKGGLYKQYTALVHGKPSSFEGEIDLPIGIDLNRGPPSMYCVDPFQGKSSFTSWVSLDYNHFNKMSTINLRPNTGRTHQLRIHLASIGLPIVGDPFYYSPDSLERDMKHEVHRLYLHADSLGLIHPRTMQPMLFQSKPTFCLDDF